MVLTEKAIKQALESTREMRLQLVDEVVAVYFSALGDNEYPSEADLLAAKKKAELDLRKRLENSRWLSEFFDNQMEEDGSLEGVSLAFNSTIGKLKIPEPARFKELKARSVALAAVLGAILGQLILTPVTRLALGMSDTGLVLGPPLGAFGMVLLIWWVSKSELAIRGLQGLLGVGSIVELSGGGFSNIWRRVRGKSKTKGLLGRIISILVFVSTILILQLAIRRPSYDQESHRKAVRSAIEQWLHEATILLAVFSKHPPGSPETHDVLGTLGRHFYNLHRCSREHLEDGVSELIQDAQHLGFEGFEDATKVQTAKTWSKQMGDKYETFGHIEEGDKVIIQEVPVILKGEVLSKGLVRKLRKKEQS